MGEKDSTLPYIIQCTAGKYEGYFVSGEGAERCYTPVAKYAKKFETKELAQLHYEDCERVLQYFETEDVGCKEMVNKPDHYGGTLVLDYIYALEALPNSQMNFARTSAIKYISRAGMKFKDKEIEDLKKVIFYINYEIERLERESN